MVTRLHVRSGEQCSDKNCHQQIGIGELTLARRGVPPALSSTIAYGGWRFPIVPLADLCCGLSKQCPLIRNKRRALEVPVEQDVCPRTSQTSHHNHENNMQWIGRGRGHAGKRRSRPNEVGAGICPRCVAALTGAADGRSRHASDFVGSRRSEPRERWRGPGSARGGRPNRQCGCRFRTFAGKGSRGNFVYVSGSISLGECSQPVDRDVSGRLGGGGAERRRCSRGSQY